MAGCHGVSERELWTTTQVAEFFGLNSAASARSRIRRLGLKPVTGPGGAILIHAETGERFYDAAKVRAVRPVGQGKGGGPKRKAVV